VGEYDGEDWLARWDGLPLPGVNAGLEGETPYGEAPPPYIEVYGDVADGVDGE